MNFVPKIPKAHHKGSYTIMYINVVFYYVIILAVRYGKTLKKNLIKFNLKNQKD